MLQEHWLSWRQTNLALQYHSSIAKHFCNNSYQQQTPPDCWSLPDTRGLHDVAARGSLNEHERSTTVNKVLMLQIYGNTAMACYCYSINIIAQFGHIKKNYLFCSIKWVHHWFTCELYNRNIFWPFKDFRSRYRSLLVTLL